MFTYSLSSLTFSIIIAVFSFSIFLVMIKKSPALIFSSELVFSVITKFSSIVFLEMNEIYISETQLTSENIGASLRFFFMTALLIISIFFSTLFFNNRSLKLSESNLNFSYIGNQDKRIILFFISFVLFLEYINFFLSSDLPIGNSNVTRWNYWDDYAAFKFLPVLFGKLIIFIPFILGVLLGYNSLLNKKSFFLIFLSASYFLYLILSGQRVNGIIAPLLYFLSSYHIAKFVIQRKFHFKNSIIFAFFFLVIILAIGYFSLQSRGVAELVGVGINVLIYRVFVLTSGAWWSLDYYIFIEGVSGSFKDIFQGMSVLRDILMDTETATIFEESNINLSGGIPIMAIYSMNLFGANLFLIIYGFFLGYLCSEMFRCIERNQFVSIFILANILMLASACFNAASLANIVSLKFIFLCFLYLLLKLNVFEVQIPR